MRFALSIFILLCFSISSYTQEFLGLKVGNYAGVHGLEINPANNVAAPKQFDVNFFTLGMSYESDYLYLEKSNILLAGLKISKLRPNPAIKKDRSEIDNPLYYNYYDRRSSNYHFYANALVALPGASVNIYNHSVGLTFKNKVAGFVNRVSPDYGYYYYEDSATTEMWLDPMKVGLLHYGEVALNYGVQLPTTGMVDVNFGVTAKYISAWDGVFLRNNIRKESIKIDDGIKIPEGADLDFNWVSSYRYDYENDKPIYKLRNQGNGFSMDIGATFANTFGDEGQVHKWKVGVALLDVGKVFINKGEVNRFITTDTVIYRSQFFENVRDLDSFRAVANYHAFEGNETQSVAGSKFSVWMPTALSVYGDFGIRNNFYLSAHAILRVPMKAVGLERSNTIAVTPRIEKENFEINLPIILHEFKYPKMGFFIRKGVFFAGSDNMTAWLIPQRLNGIDFYMGFKWSGDIIYKTRKRNLRRITLKCPVW